MANGEAAHDTGRLNVAAAVAVLVLGAWCAPALASSGVDIRCPESESALDTPLVSVSPSLAAHQDSAIEEILDHEPISMPTLAETATESDIETLGDTDAVREETTPTARTPAIITRLPGVPESSLPSFRRQMHRTDI